MTLPDIRRRALLGTAVLILAVGCNVSATLAQLGATKQTVSTQGQLEKAGIREGKVAAFLDFEPARFTSPANDVTFDLGFRNDKVVYVQIPFSRFGIEASKLAQHLANVKIFDEMQTPTDMIWRTDTRLSSLYPPLGEVRTDMLEVLKPTGIRARTVIIDTSTGLISDSTPWTELTISTGIYIPKISSKFCYQLCLASRDGKAIAIVSNEGTRGTKSEQLLNWIAVMTPEVFWDFVLRSTAEENKNDLVVGADYEMFLFGLVPENSREKVHSYRTALSIVRYAELSSAPMESVVNRFHDLGKTDPALRATIAAPLLNSNFTKLGLDARRRHYQLAGEIGDVGLIAEFTKKMPVDGDGKRQAVAALARIAERHQLEPPPLATAQISQIRDWAARVAKDK